MRAYIYTVHYDKTFPYKVYGFIAAATSNQTVALQNFQFGASLASFTLTSRLVLGKVSISNELQ